MIEKVKQINSEVKKIMGPLGIEVEVYYLDDELDIFEGMEALHKDLGVRLKGFNDPKHVLNLLKKNRRNLALIISDLQMPEMDGLKFRGEVLKIAPEIPFILLTAYVTKNLALQAIEQKISAVLSKPVEVDTYLEFFKKEVIPRLNSLKEEAELLSGFVEEAKNNLEMSEDLVLRIEQDPHDIEAINKLFGIVHTIKGSSGFFDPKTISQFSHKFEEVLKAVQKGEVAIDSILCGNILKAIDQLKILVGELELGEDTGSDPQKLFEQIFQDSDSSEASKPEFESARAKKDLDSCSSPTTLNDPKSQKKEIKVGIDTLDEFLRISGDMTVIRNMVNKSLKNVEKKYPGDKEIINLEELLEELHKVNSTLQSKVGDLRKISFKTLLKPIVRAVRDASQKLSKVVELKVEGEDLRFDNVVCEALNNSLIHLVRNSIDHGIEMPQKRVDLGKMEKGKIIIKAEEKDDNIYIEIQDDGAGINTEAIKNKLRKNGTFNENEIEEMSENQLFLQIFSPGFSTAEKITDISGRGVGMSMVKDSIEVIGGTLSIFSELGQGTRFCLKIPTPKAVLITNCLFFRCASEVFGVAQDAVFRIIGNEKNLINFEGANCLEVDGGLVSILDLGKRLQITKEEVSSLEDGKQFVVLSLMGKFLAFLVDEILEIEDTVIKTLPKGVDKNHFFKGATFLGDGKVGLILRPEGFYEELNYKITPERMKEVSYLGLPGLDSCLESAIVFEMFMMEGRYAVRQKDIFRVEEISGDEIKMVGLELVAQYKNTILHLIPCDSIFRETLELEMVVEKDKVQIIVFQVRGYYLGLIVKSVCDLVSLPWSDESQVELGKQGISPIVSEGEIITMLDVDHIGKKFFDLKTPVIFQTKEAA